MSTFRSLVEQQQMQSCDHSTLELLIYGIDKFFRFQQMILSALHSTRSALIFFEVLLKVQMYLHPHLLFLASELPVELGPIFSILHLVDHSRVI
jgi:hypothetical protein